MIVKTKREVRWSRAWILGIGPRLEILFCSWTNKKHIYFVGLFLRIIYKSLITVWYMLNYETVSLLFLNSFWFCLTWLISTIGIFFFNKGLSSQVIAGNIKKLHPKFSLSDYNIQKSEGKLEIVCLDSTHTRWHVYKEW